MQDTINGFAVIASFAFTAAPATRPGRVIIVDRGADKGGYRYVSAVQYGWAQDDLTVRLDREWHGGRYVSTLTEAFADFKTRVAENARHDLKQKVYA